MQDDEHLIRKGLTAFRLVLTSTSHFRYPEYGFKSSVVYTRAVFLRWFHDSLMSR